MAEAGDRLNMKLKTGKGETYDDFARRCLVQAQKLVIEDGVIGPEAEFLLRAAQTYATLEVARVQQVEQAAPAEPADD